MLLGFMQRWTEPVSLGIKPLTIREPRKVKPKIGEKVYLYIGLRTRSCRKVGVGILEAACQIHFVTGKGIELRPLDLAIVPGFTSSFEENRFVSLSKDGYDRIYHFLKHIAFPLRWTKVCTTPLLIMFLDGFTKWEEFMAFHLDGKEEATKEIYAWHLVESVLDEVEKYPDEAEPTDCSCPVCLNSQTLRRECNSCGGDGFRDDLHDEDPLWYSPGETNLCSECSGAGIQFWCPRCGSELNRQLIQVQQDREEGVGHGA